MPDQGENFNFNISLSVLNHLGRNLYRNFVTVLGEAISNSWDAGAKNVWITVDKEKDSFSIVDDGDGMDANGFQNKFLKIGYSKRGDNGRTRSDGRPFIGAKGIGKLALLSCAEDITILSKTASTDWVGGKINNHELDDAIEHDIEPSMYSLDPADKSIFEDVLSKLDKGTAIHFADMNDEIKNSERFLRKMIAMTFRFSMIDPEFVIHLNGQPVTIKDLSDLANKTQFLWKINGYEDEYTKTLSNLGRPPIEITHPLNFKGFLATVEKPRHAKITGTDERASIDLFVNGRLREKNVGRHFPSQRIVESYLYGIIVYDVLDAEGGPDDAFTSSREGVKETEPKFKALLEAMKKDVLKQVLDDWDRLRLDMKQDGDPENTKRKTKKDRAAQTLYTEAKADFSSNKDDKNHDEVDTWLEEIRPDAEYNLSSYGDIYISENLVRRYIKNKNPELTKPSEENIDKWRKLERKAKDKAGISYNIRHEDDDLNYLDLKSLAFNAEDDSERPNRASLHGHAVTFKPMRDALAHTARLTDDAKGQLTLVLSNIKSRVRSLLAMEQDDPIDKE